MMLSFINRGPVFTLAVVVCAWSLNARADWGSIHANNRSRTTPQRPAFRPAPQRVNPPTPTGRTEQTYEPNRTPSRPEVYRGEGRGEERERGEREVGRAREPERNTAGIREWESARRRGDFDEDRRSSFAWSRFHRGMVVNVLPPGYFEFYAGGAPYYYSDGIYYEPQSSGYVVVAPPVGAVVPALPPGVETIVAGPTIYYYANGTFYVQQPNGFQVVPAPLGVTVGVLPPDAVPVVINGTLYYQSNGVNYLPVMQNGVTVYMTAQP